MNIKSQGHSLTLVQSHLDSTFSNFFSLETARPIEAKFHVELSWDEGTKEYSNCPGHMTSMATIPIYGKNLKKSSSLEPKGWWPWNLVYSIEYYQVCWNDDHGLTLTYFMARSNLVPYAFVWEKGKTMDFSETIVIFDITVGRCSQLNVYMNIYEYQRSRSFIDLHQRSLSFDIFKPLFLRNL